MVTLTELLAFVLVPAVRGHQAREIASEVAGGDGKRGRPLALRERLFNHITQTCVNSRP